MNSASMDAKDSFRNEALLAVAYTWVYTLLTLSTTHELATDLGYPLHKSLFLRRVHECCLGVGA